MAVEEQSRAMQSSGWDDLSFLLLLLPVAVTVSGVTEDLTKHCYSHSQMKD